MASLSCLSIFEAGAFASDSGNVLVPTTEDPFTLEPTEEEEIEEDDFLLLIL